MENIQPEKEPPAKPFRILALDGGGAKGFYTLGILSEIEAMTKRRISQSFDLIYGTSTGAIIAALLAKGEPVTTVMALYENHVPSIMTGVNTGCRTKALHALAHTVFKKSTHKDFKTLVGIVATNWKDEKPMIFKTSFAQAHGAIGSFEPFFGVLVADAVIASCSAYPFFNRHTVTKNNGDVVELGDGGFCANNPTLYAIADATRALKQPHENLRVVSLGVGHYPQPAIWKNPGRLMRSLTLMLFKPGSDFLQKVLGTNSNSMDTLQTVLFKEVPTIRISDAFVEPELATDLLEHDLPKLNRLVQKGRQSFHAREEKLREFLMG